MERVFEKVAVQFPGGGGQRGSLVLSDGALEFRSKKGTMQLPNVKRLYVTGDYLTIEYGDGPALRSANFMDQGHGLMRGQFRAANEQLLTDIRQGLGLAPPSHLEQEEVRDLVRDREVSKKRDLEREGLRYMRIGGLMLVVGTLVTLLTFQAALESGGAYLVAWGAILFGGLGLVGGFIQWRIAKRPFDEVAFSDHAKTQRTDKIVIVAVLAAGAGVIAVALALAFLVD